ncbi:MAG: EscT/YscT/HrcT family type III secretion system export apparatus protein [Oxalobacteraceae bacterium]|nr:EscT/YscT/HrcT family type III secretion system export apparatus protein [Oxalobacteraceae bacterium]
MEAILIEYPSAVMLAGFYALPRMLAMFSMLPMFNRQALPGLLRIGVASAFAVFLVPMLLDTSFNELRHGGMMIGILAKEAMVGFLIGFFVAIPIWAVDVMGVFVDNQRGASIAATINPLTGHDTSPLGELFSQAALVLLLISGGILMLLDLVYASYLIWPVFKLLPSFSDQTPMLLLGQLDRLMTLAVLLSAPVIFAMFLAEIGLAIVSRFVPQLQVFFMAMPIKSAIAMYVFAVYMATLLGYISNEIAGFPNTVSGVLNSIFSGPVK